MDLLIVFLLLQAIFKLKFVYNSKLIFEKEEEDYDECWGAKGDDMPLTPISRLILDESLSQSSYGPLEVSPNSVTEMKVEDDFNVTKEWIENILIPSFKAGKMIPISVIKKIIREAKFNFACEDTIEDIYAPDEGKLVIVGDIHGQFESTLTIFEDLGYPSQRTAYLFNGDIIDRGDKSLECILMIFAYKIALFGQFHVTRGNHESLSCGFGSFYEECQRRLANYPNAFKDFQYAFESLPYGYIVEGKYFVTHGGIGPDMLVKDLKYLFRTEYSYSNHSCLMAMLWNDPCEDTVPVNEYLMAPSGRGKFCMKFHPNLTKIFLDNHGLELLIRSHQVAMEGWELSQYDMCLTLFSAPNYVNIGNRGAVLVVTEEKISIQGMRA